MKQVNELMKPTIESRPGLFDCLINCIMEMEGYLCPAAERQKKGHLVTQSFEQLTERFNQLSDWLTTDTKK